MAKGKLRHRITKEERESKKQPSILKECFKQKAWLLAVVFVLIGICAAFLFGLPLNSLLGVHSPSQHDEGYLSANEELLQREGSSYEAIKNFRPERHFSLRPKKVKIDDREIVFRHLEQKVKQSKIDIFIADNFLSHEECDALSAVHSRHVIQQKKMPPLICFDSSDTLKKNLDEAKIGDFKRFRFVPGTQCLNETMSKFLEPHFFWSYSTAFYPGESKFSHEFQDRVEKATGLKKSHGGKFQITSYAQNVGYKNHTDCTVGSGFRDRYATVLVYLQDVKEGGETIFPLLGVKVKPKKGRLLVWNSMSKDGSCNELSLHNAAKVIKGHKFILQRWYYYENFYSLGKRVPGPELPKRKEGQPRVSCDQYEYGSCRWYDEWGYDHVIEYNRVDDYLL